MVQLTLESLLIDIQPDKEKRCVRQAVEAGMLIVLAAVSIKTMLK